MKKILVSHSALLGGLQGFQKEGASGSRVSTLYPCISKTLSRSPRTEPWAVAAMQSFHIRKARGAAETAPQ